MNEERPKVYAPPLGCACVMYTANTGGTMSLSVKVERGDDIVDIAQRMATVVEMGLAALVPSGATWVPTQRKDGDQ